MRLAVTAVIICLSVLWAVQPAVSQSTAKQAEPIDTSIGQSDAAEKHAKRTACFKDAKAKKLVGAQRNAYMKDCMAANPPPYAQPVANPAAP